jgi:hypothetical protein
MIRQRLLSKVIGRRLLERLVGAGWLVPIRVGSGLFYRQYDIHRALKRLGREGFLLNGHARNGFRVETKKVHRRTLEEAFADFSLKDL